MGLLHFNDDDERERYALYCRAQREEALARWGQDGNFMNAWDADFWLLQMLRAGSAHSAELMAGELGPTHPLCPSTNERTSL
jgi:hypothetical protein